MFEYSNEIIEENKSKRTRIFRDWFTLYFKEKEFEDEYKKKKYGRFLFFYLTMVLLIIVLVNGIYFDSIRLPVLTPVPVNKTVLVPANNTNSNSSVFISANSTAVTNNTVKKNITVIEYKMKPKIVVKDRDVYYNFSTYGLATAAFALSLLGLFDKKRKFVWVYQIVSVMIQIYIRNLNGTWKVWANQIFKIDFANDLLINNIGGIFFLVYNIFVDPCWYLSMIAVTILIIIFYIIVPLNATAEQYFLLYFYNFIYYGVLIYFIEKTQRESFFHNLLNKKHKTQLIKLLDNLNLGITVFKKNVPVFVNNFIKDRLIMCWERSREESANDKNTMLFQNNNLTETPLILFSNTKDRKNFYKNFDFCEFLGKYVMANLELCEEMFDDYDNNQDLVKELKIVMISKLKESEIVHKFIELVESNKDYFHTYRYIGSKRMKSKNNEAILINVYANYNPTEDTVKFIFNDISQVAQVEEIKSVMKFRTLFLSKVAHEFKNPLLSTVELIDELRELDLLNETSINNRAQSVTVPNNDIAEQIKENIKIQQIFIKEKLHHIKNLSDFMCMLVKDFDFLSSSDMDQALQINLEHLRLKELVSFCIEIFETRIKMNSKNIEISFSIDENVPRVIYSDEIRLKQILLNLLSNSYKFTTRGFIKLKVSKEINEHDGASFIKFTVADSGPGIASERIPSLTKPFNKFTFTGNNLGAGLGLSIVVDIVSKLGKGFHIDSIVGQGTKISFMIPVDHSNSSITNKSMNANNALMKRREMRYISANNSSKSISSKSKDENYNNNNNRSVHLVSVPPLRKPSRFSSLNKNESETPKLPLYPSNLLDNLDNIHNNDKRQSNICNYPFNFLGSTSSVNTKLIDYNFYIPYNQPSTLELVNSINESDKQEIEIENEPNIIISRTKSEDKIYNFLVVDDEVTLRRSTIRVLKKFFEEKQIECNYTECSDGVECLYYLYKGSNVKYNAIITDESMLFINGSGLCSLVNSLINDNVLYPIPVFLCSGHERASLISNTKDKSAGVFMKPLNKSHVERIYEILLGTYD